MSKIAIQRNLEVLLILSFMDLKLKYQGSTIGFVWSFLKPLLQFGVYYTIFGLILNVSSGPSYALALFFGVLVWTWFAEGTSLGLNCFIGKRSIISKIKTNKIFPPLAAFLTPTMSYGLNFLAFTLAYVYFVPEFPSHLLSLTHLLVLLSSLLSIGLIIVSCNLVLANLNVFYRDIQPIWELVLIYGVFLTPIIYRIPLPAQYELPYYLVNLLAFPLQNLKSIFFIDQLPLYTNIMLSSGYAVVLLSFFALACLIHKRLSKKVVDFL